MTVKHMEQKMPGVTGKHAFVAAGAPPPWALVAGGGKAQVFSLHHQDFHLLHEITPPVPAPESRRREEELAQAAGAFIEEQFSRHKFNELILIAPPQVLGALRKNLSGPLVAAVIATVDRELGGLGEEDLRRELLNLMPGPGLA